MSRACNASLTLLLVSLFVILCFATPTEAIVRFVLQNTHQLCFIEDIEDDKHYISGEYTRESGPSQNVPVELSIINQAGVKVNEIELVVGTHSFTAPLHGEIPSQYTLCVQAQKKGWSVSVEREGISLFLSTDRSSASSGASAPLFKRQKVKGMEVFTFRDYGGQQKDVLKPVEYIKHVENEVRNLRSLLAETSRDSAHLINRFTRMRRTSLNTSTRICVFGVATVLTIIVVVWLQFFALKSTLRQKKLV